MGDTISVDVFSLLPFPSLAVTVTVGVELAIVWDRLVIKSKFLNKKQISSVAIEC